MISIKCLIAMLMVAMLVVIMAMIGMLMIVMAMLFMMMLFMMMVSMFISGVFISGVLMIGVLMIGMLMIGMLMVFMAMGFAVGPTLGIKGRHHGLHRQAPVLQKLSQYRILQQPQLIGVDLHRHVAIAQVIGRLQQSQGAVGPHPQQRLRGCLHLHQRLPLGRGQQLAGHQGRPAGQLQQQGPAAAAVAQAPQSRALLRPQGQPQRPCHRGAHRQAAAEQQRSGVAGLWGSGVGHGQQALP